MKFIDNHSDLNTVNYLSKSVQPNILEKALDHSGLVQKEIQYKTPTGKIATRKQWVKAGESQPAPQPIKQAKEQEKVPATPFTITEKTKHLVAIESLSELPDHIKNLNKPIPPDWRQVMVSPDPDADLLVVGKDSKNRPQYIYSDSFMNRTKAEKFERVKALMNKRDDLQKALELMEDRETADCLNLMLQMGLRPGSTRDTKSKVEALGATTLRGENVVEENGQVYLRFIGKKGVQQNHEVPASLVKMLVKRKIASGNKGDLFNTDDTKLRTALKPIGVKPKDLRTMLANTSARDFLSDIEPVESAKEFVRLRNIVGDHVSAILGNQRTVALSYYIDPSVFESWSPKAYNDWKNSQAESTIEEETA